MYDAPHAQHPQEQGLDILYDAVDAVLASGAESFADDRALIRFGLRLALTPRSMNANRLEPLRAEGWTDREIHDAVSVVGCFSYMNRLADGLGVAKDDTEWAVRLLGQARTDEHRAWAEGR